MDEQRDITFILFSSQHRGDNGRHRVHDHRLNGAAADGPLRHMQTCGNEPAAYFWESPGATGRLNTHLLKRAGAEAVQTVEQREDIKQAEDLDPLKSFHLGRQRPFHNPRNLNSQANYSRRRQLQSRGPAESGSQQRAGSHSPALPCYWFRLPASAAGARRSAPQWCPQTPRFVSDGERCARWQRNTPEEATERLTEGAAAPLMAESDVQKCPPEICRFPVLPTAPLTLQCKILNPAVYPGWEKQSARYNSQPPQP